MSCLRLIVLVLASKGMLLPVGVLLGEAPRNAPAVDEFTKLGGSWRIVQVEMSGEPREESFVIAFRDGRFVRRGKTKTYTGSYRLNPLAQPHQISIIKDESPTKKPLLGIYEIKGDTLRICFGSDRPTEFATRRGQNAMLLVLRHQSNADARGKDDR